MFRPCIDIHENKVKQIVGGTLNTNKLETNFVSTFDADYYANLFKKDGLCGGHVIMLGSGNESQAERAISAYPNGLQIGGGINLNNAKFWLDKGASHVIITSWLFDNGMVSFDKLKLLNKSIGKKNLVIDLSCRKKNNDYFVVINKWQTFTETIINKETIQKISEFCDELLIHAVDVEGKANGIDLTLISNLASWALIPITYAGGAKSVKDLKTVHQIGNGRIHLTIGSALDIFGGNLIKYADAVKFNNSIINIRKTKF